MGHEVKLYKAKDVKAYVQGDKDDPHDAAAVAESGTRRHLCAVPINSVEQQDLQSLHRARELLVKQRTAVVNQARGLLSEYGVVMAQGLGVFQRRIPRVLEDAENGLTAGFRGILAEMVERIGMFNERIAHYGRQVAIAARSDDRCRRLLEVEGLGPISATALVAAVGDARHKTDPRSRWVNRIVAKSGPNVAAVVVANKNARIAWALLTRGERYQPRR